MKTVIYARVSTSHHDQRPEIQINELKKWCDIRGWEVSHEIVDHGFSGVSDNRPGLKKLLTLVRSGKVEAVVVMKLDRLFRSLKHLVTTLEEFEKLGVHFVATKDNVDYSTPSGRFFVQVLGSLGEFERSLLRERTMLGLEHARSIGKVFGRPRVHDPQKIFDLHEQGLSYREIRNAIGAPLASISDAIKSVRKTSTIHTQKTTVRNTNVKRTEVTVKIDKESGDSVSLSDVADSRVSDRTQGKESKLWNRSS